MADQFFLPYLSTLPFFNRIEFIQHSSNGTTIVNPTEKITITENTAIEEAVEKIRARLVVVQAYRGQTIINQATGFIMTSDGLIISSSDLVYTQASQYLVLKDNLSLSAKLIKTDSVNNLALFEVEEHNLPVVSLVNLENLSLGQRVLLVGAEPGKDNLNYFVNWGIVRGINQEVLRLNLNEYNSMANGSPLVNVKGEVIGLNIVSQKGLIKTVPADKIKEFLDL